MCFEYEPDRHVRDEQEQEQAREEIRRLFERYRAARQRPGWRPGSGTRHARGAGPALTSR